MFLAQKRQYKRNALSTKARSPKMGKISAVLVHTKWKTTFLEPFNVLFESKSQKPHHFFVVAYKKSVILQ